MNTDVVGRGRRTNNAGGSPVPPANRDQVLKLRTRRILWSQGYHCPLEVDLSHFEYDEQQNLRRSSLTDIDLLAIRFDPDLRRRVVVADCKSGEESEPNRLFWLRGVMTFFGAQEGLFVKAALRSPARALAPRLGIRVLDERALEVLEHSIRVEETAPRSVGDKTIDDRIRELWGIKVGRGQKPTEEQLQIKRVIQYLQYFYWMVEDHRNIQTLIDRFSDIAKFLHPKELTAKYLCYIGLLRFTLSLLTMASEVGARDVNDIERQSRVYIFGGSLSLREREHTIALLNQIARKQDLFKENIRLDPPYFTELIEVVNRLIKNSLEAARILHHLDAVVYECVLGSSTRIDGVLGTAFRTDALVLGKRIAALFQRVTSLSDQMFSELLSL